MIIQEKKINHDHSKVMKDLGLFVCLFVLVQAVKEVKEGVSYAISKDGNIDPIEDMIQHGQQSPLINLELGRFLAKHGIKGKHHVLFPLTLMSWHALIGRQGV